MPIQSLHKSAPTDRPQLYIRRGTRVDALSTRSMGWVVANCPGVNAGFLSNFPATGWLTTPSGKTVLSHLWSSGMRTIQSRTLPVLALFCAGLLLAGCGAGQKEMARGDRRTQGASENSSRPGAAMDPSHGRTEPP